MKDKMKQEAIERMKMLKLSSGCIKAFQRGEVWESEGIGALYDLTKEEQKIVDDFEKKNNGLVYHVIHNMTEFGELYSLLFVGKYEEEWQMDRQDIEENIVFAYVYNKTDDWCSEFGSIMVKPNIGGLIRMS